MHTLASLFLLLGLAACCHLVSSMPHKLHCLAQVNLMQVSASIDRFRVEEFLDLHRRRSSVSLTSERTGDIAIYYNKLNARGGDLSERKSILYEPARNACKSQRIIHWPLAELRKVAIYLHDPRLLADGSIEDTPLGPSVLLHAIEMNPKRFQFRKQIPSEAMLNYANAFTSQVEIRALGRIERIRVLVHTRSRAFETLQPGNSSLADAFPVVSEIANNVRFVGAYRLADEGATSGNELEAPLEEHEFCAPGKILFGVHFEVIEQHVEGTLIGRRLEDFTSRYEFAREPHLQPVGIGCWDRDTNLGFQMSLLGETNSGALKLSAQSVSSMGPSGTTFVAYDERAHLLRFDRNGRMAVYDLAKAKAYHLVRAPGASEPEKCVVLDMDDSSNPGTLEEQASLVTARDHVLEQLVGLGSTGSGGGDRAHYLGTRIVDHQEYEVYERELTRVPILLQAHRYKLKNNKRLLVTYYTRAPQASELAASLHYIELWQFDLASEERKLVNRVTFTEFSWSVGDLIPSGGVGASKTGDLFDLAACRQSRAAQAQLEMVYVQDDANCTTLSEAHLRDNRQELSNRLKQVVADTLEVSSLNLADFRVAIAAGGANRSLEIAASCTLTEMRTGSLGIKFLGVVHHDQVEMHKHAVRYLPNRHSLDECKLDSIERGRKSHLLAYCAHLTLCVLLSPDAGLALQESQPLDEDPKTVATRDDECRVYSLKYATQDATSGRRALEQAQANEIRLRDAPLEFEFNYLDHTALGNKLETATFRARLRTSSLELLDPLGARLDNNLAALEGLSYSPSGASTQQNGSRIASFRWLASRPDDKPASIFGHCQLACQLDETCGSFSVCTKGTNAGNCVLSPVRLTGERVSKLNEAKRAQQPDKISISLNVGTPDEQICVLLEHRGGCSLHGRDFLADFRASKSVDLSHAQATSEPSKDREDLTEQQFTTTLDDCAGMSFERSLGNPNQTTSSFISFTYCPLESLCILGGDDVMPLRNESTVELGRCLVYSRQALGAYEKKTLTHLVVRPARAPGGSRANSRTSQAEDYKARVTLRTFYTEHEDVCARECNLPASDCLSLDICQGAGKKHLCLLYAIRSPLAKRGAYLPLLAREQSLLTEFNTALANNPICNHFFLKQPFFETKLKHLLTREKLLPDCQSLDQTLGQPANKIDLADVLRGKMIAAASGRDDGPKTVFAAHMIGPIHRRGTVTSFISSIYALQLAVGLVLGSLIAAYKQPLSNAAASLCLWAQLISSPVRRDITPLVTRGQSQ